MLWILAIGALIGIVPESGPHLIFVMMYAQGLVPFSVLFTTSFVQDGHGMLLMISYSLKDSVLIKVDDFVKSRKTPFFVILAKAGIQSIQGLTKALDSGFHRSDDFLRVHQL